MAISTPHETVPVIYETYDKLWDELILPSSNLNYATIEV